MFYSFYQLNYSVLNPFERFCCVHTCLWFSDSNLYLK